MIDGEVVALDEEGRPSFNLLQNYGSATTQLVYYVFDVLILAGGDVMREPLDVTRLSVQTSRCRGQLPQRRHRHL